MTYPADRQLRRQRRGRREPPALGRGLRRPRAEPPGQQLPRRAARSTPTWQSNGIIGIEGIDTRALVRLTRVRGAMKGILSTTDLDDASLVAKAQASPGMVGRDLVREVMPRRAVHLGAGLRAADSPCDRRARPRPRRADARRGRTSSRSTTA